jgi:hypothetical protein
MIRIASPDVPGTGIPLCSNPKLAIALGFKVLNALRTRSLIIGRIRSVEPPRGMEPNLRYDPATEIEMAALNSIEIGHAGQMPPFLKSEFFKNADAGRINVEKNCEQRLQT